MVFFPATGGVCIAHPGHVCTIKRVSRRVRRRFNRPCMYIKRCDRSEKNMCRAARLETNRMHVLKCAHQLVHEKMRIMLSKTPRHIGHRASSGVVICLVSSICAQLGQRQRWPQGTIACVRSASQQMMHEFSIVRPATSPEPTEARLSRARGRSAVLCSAANCRGRP